MADEKKIELFEETMRKYGVYKEGVAKLDEKISYDNVSKMIMEDNLGIKTEIYFQNNVVQTGILVMNNKGTAAVYKDFMYPMSSLDVRKIIEEEVVPVFNGKFKGENEGFDVMDVVGIFETVREKLKKEEMERNGTAGKDYCFTNEKENYTELGMYIGNNNKIPMLFKISEMDNDETFLYMRTPSYKYRQVPFCRWREDMIIDNGGCPGMVRKDIEEEVKNLREVKKEVQPYDVIDRLIGRWDGKIVKEPVSCYGVKDGDVDYTDDKSILGVKFVKFLALEDGKRGILLSEMLGFVTKSGELFNGLYVYNEKKDGHDMFIFKNEISSFQAREFLKQYREMENKKEKERKDEPCVSRKGGR